MRLAILGFALGIWWLQQQSALPDSLQQWQWTIAAATSAVIAAMIAVVGSWLRVCRISATTRAISSTTLPTSAPTLSTSAPTLSISAPTLSISAATLSISAATTTPTHSFWRRAVASSASVAIVLAACAATTSLGFLYAALSAERRMADELPQRWEGENIRLVGIVSGLPALNGSDRSTRFAFDVERVITPDAIVPKRVSLAWYAGWRGAKSIAASDGPPALHAGERWQLTVRLRRPHGNANPHGFDLEAWMLENGLRASGHVRTDEANRRIDAFSGRFIDRVDALREGIRERILRALEGRPYAGVIVALTIGDQRSVPQDQWELYNRTGVSHLLSISGLHVTLFATLVGGAVFWLWRRSQWLTTRLPARKAAALVGALASFGYVLLAGFEVPAQRTLYMLIVAAVGLWIGRPGTAYTVLMWALLAVVLIDPWAVTAAGFWLSFGAVALLMYIAIGRLPATGRWAWLMSASQAQWAITLGMVPLMLALFQQVSLVSPLANVFAIPVVSLIVVPMALGWLVLPLDFVLVAAHALFALVVVGLEWLNALPSAVWTQHAPPAWAVAAGVVGILLLLAPLGLHVRLLGFVWLSPLFVLLPQRPDPGAVWFEVLDVGQGLAVVVQTNRHTLLYDTGARFTDLADAGNRIIAPYLRARGLANLDAMIVTHADADHSGGALSVLETVPVRRLHSSLSDDNRIVMRRAARGEPSERCEAGQSWTWDGVDFHVMHPSVDSYLDLKRKTNDRGCVIQVTSVHGTALLTADIEARSEAELLQREPARLRSDIMLVPHHGSKTSSTAAFLDAVQPRLAIAAAGYRNRFGHPRAEVIARYDERNIRLLRSDWHGAVEVRFDGGAPKVRAWRSGAQPYWRDRPEREQTALE